MKSCYRVFLLFTVLLMSIGSLQASIEFNIKKTAKYIITHPLKSALTYARMGAEGAASLYAGAMCFDHTCNLMRLLKEQGLHADKKALDRQFRQGVLCFSLGLTSLVCGSWFLYDLKAL